MPVPASLAASAAHRTSPAPEPERKAYSVSKVVASADRALRAKTGPLWVRGEISGWTEARSGHCYFTLKDDRAALSCMLFADCAHVLPALPENGMEVLVFGQVGIYRARGQFQLTAETVEATQIGGMWQVAMDRLIAQLRSEGLLEEARKRPLPRLPERVGIVTSAQGAALHDMHRALRRKAWWVRTIVAHCSVEGAGCADEIAAALRRFGPHPGGCAVDVVIVARGGGSRESLWAFNLEPVARAIATCPVPVISAVGHETDYTVADLVADVRAATPTAGAERAVPDGTQVLAALEAFPREAARPLRRLLAARGELLARTHRELHRSTQRRADRLRLALDGADRHLEARSPRRLLESAATELERLEREVHASAARRVDTLEQRLAAAAEALDARSPLRALSRGYALLTDEDERVVRSAGDLTPGQRLRARLADGVAEVHVDAVTPLPSPSSDP